MPRGKLRRYHFFSWPRKAKNLTATEEKGELKWNEEDSHQQGI